MDVHCTLHRKEPAHFQCHECGAAFCENCISIKENHGYSGKDKEYFCPACDWPASMVSLGNVIEPFWKKLTAIFLYPLQPVPLILTLLLSLLGALFPENLFVRLFIWIAMMKYAYAALINTAQGGLKAPAITFQLINADV